MHRFQKMSSTHPAMKLQCLVQCIRRLYVNLMNKTSILTALNKMLDKKPIVGSQWSLGFCCMKMSFIA